MSTPIHTPPAAEVDRDNPWPGLSSFTEDLRSFFFGREKETDELVRLVRRNTLTVLFGQSGLGKSSLLQAGVFPLLREADCLPLYLRLDHDPATPPLADQVKAALVEAIKLAGADAPVPRADESLWEYFHRKDIDIWSAKNRLLTPVLAFDQFEEIFTLGRTDDARRERGRAFLTELADLVENRPPAALRAKFDKGELDTARYNFDKPSCQVILSLREDFLPDLEGLKTEMRSLMHNRMRVRRLTGTQALEIVTRPAPHLLAEGVAERVVEFVSGARGGSAERLEEMEVEPSLLSVICRELNQRRRTLGQEQITADLVSGNRREILNDFYERSVSDLPPAMREYIEDHLLTKSGFRDNVALETVLEAPGVTRALVDTLVSRRLLRIEDRLGVQRVELTHDVLADVISASRDSRHERQALDEAKRQLTVQKEREAATRRSLVRARFVAAVAIVVMLLAAGSAVFGFINLNRARIAEQQAEQAKAGEIKLREQAEAQELAARQRAYASDMKVALQALHGDNLGQALSLLNRQRPQPGEKDLRGWEWRYLWQQTRSDALATLYQNQQSEISAVTVSPDGRWLATGMLHRDGLIVWDLATREQVAALAPGQSGIRAAFSPTEPLLAFVSTNSVPLADGGTPPTTLHFWNTATRQMVAEYPLGASGLGLAFSRDGQSLVTSAFPDANGDKLITLWRVRDGAKLAAYPSTQQQIGVVKAFDASADLSVAAYGTVDGTIRVVDLRDGHDLWTAPATRNVITSVAFSPDGRTLATAAGFEESDIRLWDVATGAELGRLEGHGAWVSTIVFWPDGTKLASTSADQTIRTWDLASRKCTDVLRGHRQEVWRLALLPDGRTLVSGSKDGEVCFWDASVLHPRQERITWPEPVANWKFAEDGRSILTLNQAGQVAKWTGPEYGRKEILFELGTIGGGIFSNGARQMAVTLPDGQIEVWDVARRTRLGRIKPANPGELLVGITAEGSRLQTFSRTDNREREWDLATNREIQSWPSATFAASGAISPDERLSVVLGSFGDASFRDLPGKRSTKPKLDFLEASGTAFSSDGLLFAVSSHMGYVRVWETATWREIMTVRGFRIGTHAVNFSPDTQRLVAGAGSSDEAIKLWDTDGWQQVFTLPAEGQIFRLVSFSSDGNAVGARNSEGRLFVWRAPSWEEIAAAEKNSGGK